MTMILRALVRGAILINIFMIVYNTLIISDINVAMIHSVSLLVCIVSELFSQHNDSLEKSLEVQRNIEERIKRRRM